MNKFLLASMAFALACGPVSAQLQWKTMEPVAQKSNLFPKGNFKLNKVISNSAKQSRAGEDKDVPFSAKTLSNMGGWDRNIYEIADDGRGNDIGAIYNQVFGKSLMGSVFQVATAYEPALLARFDGNKITQIKTKVGPNCKNLKAFILNGLTGELLWEGKELSAINNTTSKSKDVTFKCDYVIDQNTFIIVGFEVVAKSTTTTIPAVNNIVSNGLLMGNGESFVDLSGGASAYIDCVTEGNGGLRDNDVKVLSVTGGRVLANGEYEASASFINYGAKPVSSLNAAYTVNKETQEQSLKATEKPLPYMTPVQVGFKAKSPAEAAQYLQNFTITKVNDVDDEYTETNVITEEEDNTVYNILTSIEKSYPRTVVMEQFTGTWCGWCPRGHVGMEKAAKACPDQFIGIAVHANDNMEAAEYAPLVQLTGGSFPSAMLSRIGYSIVDPYYGSQGPSQDPQKSGDIVNDIKAIASMPVEASVNLSSSFNGNSIDVVSYLDFSLQTEGAYYSVAYVLLENGLNGYTQSNFYGKGGPFQSADQIVEDDLRFLYNEGRNGKYTPTFNNVARSIKDVGGIEGSLDDVKIQQGVKVTHSYNIPLPANVANKENLEVVVLLLDNLTGEILNAKKAKVGDATAIEDVTADAAEIVVANGAINVNGNGKVSLYTVDGKLVNSVNVNGSVSVSTVGLKGTYVVRVVDGSNLTVKKVML